MNLPPLPSSQAGEPKVIALLLAAGLSRRMGDANKLLIEIGGEPMIRRAARVLLESGLDVTVVTGHEHERLGAALAGLNVKMVHNPDFRAGRRSSVLKGLEAAGADCDAVLVALGDQPWLDAADIAALVGAFAASTRDKFIVPYFHGQRGNPVIIPRIILDEIAALPGNLPRGPLTGLFPDRIERFDAASDHFVRDIDTPEALEQFRQRE